MQTPKSDKRRDPPIQRRPFPASHPESDTLVDRGQRQQKHSVDRGRDTQIRRTHVLSGPAGTPRILRVGDTILDAATPSATPRSDSCDSLCPLASHPSPPVPEPAGGTCCGPAFPGLRGGVDGLGAGDTGRAEEERGSRRSGRGNGLQGTGVQQKLREGGRLLGPDQGPGALGEGRIGGHG